MKIYLDACCLNRPFDDQRQPRVRLEAEAITLILQKLHEREWEWVGSDILFYELEQTKDAERRNRLLLLARQSHKVVGVTNRILSQAEIFENSGFDGYDAIHLACAQQEKVNVFLTTDDFLQKAADRNRNLFSFAVVNPVKWLEEVLK